MRKVMLAALLFNAGPASAAVTIAVTTVYGPQTSVNGEAGGVVRNGTEQINFNGGIAGFDASSSFGVNKVMSFAAVFPEGHWNTYSKVESIWRDTLVVSSGASGTGILKVAIDARGALSTYSTDGSSASTLTSYDIGTSDGFSWGFGHYDYAHQNNTFDTKIKGITVISIPIVFGQSFGVSSRAACGSQSNYYGSYSHCLLGDSVYWGGIVSVTNSDGSAVSDWTVASASGTDYTSSFAAAVPEPATWAMMIGGFGMIGGAMRSARRKEKVSVTFA